MELNRGLAGAIEEIEEAASNAWSRTSADTPILQGEEFERRLCIVYRAAKRQARVEDKIRRAGYDLQTWQDSPYAAEFDVANEQALDAICGLQEYAKAAFRAALERRGAFGAKPRWRPKA